MSTLSSKEKSLFSSEIRELRQQLENLKPSSMLQSLEKFENQLTLDELEICFSGSEPDTFNANFIHLLSMRWERIRRSNLCYTQQPTNLVNQLCFKIAQAISPPSATASEIEKLPPNTGPYCLLMPSLENSIDIYSENIHSLGLHEFVLSDNERTFIPIVQCLHQASISDEGQLRQIAALDGEYPELTPGEIERVSHHSKQANELYQAVIAFNKQRLLCNDIGAKLSQLVVALRSGGSHTGRGSGSELNAGAEANLGILAFHDYWVTLPKRQKLAIFAETPELKNILGRLFRPDDVNYKEVRFCVELLANALDPIIEKYNAKPTILTLYNLVLKKEHLFKTARKSHHGLEIIQKKIPPRHILHRMFKLKIDEQKKLFKQYKNALMYALKHDPDALTEFDLDEKSKQYAITVQVNANHDSALIVAAKKGKTDAIKLLLSWGAQIESPDLYTSTALHWAANNGYIDAVNCLLDNGALLEARGAGNSSALNFAVMHGKEDVVELLLKKNANLNARCTSGKNALDFAIRHYPKLIKPILKQLATLASDEQAECLLNVPDGPYPNVLFYAAAKKQTLFDELVNIILQQPNQTSISAIFDASNEKGRTPLLLAAQIGAHESLRKILASGLDIESHDLNNSTALHWAANNGHIDVVNCLLDNGALLEARGDKNNSALDFAVMYGKEAVVELLLKKNANLNVRNTYGKNALDIAIARHPKLIKPILMQLATLPLEEQAECLLNVPGGPYEDVYGYAAIKMPWCVNSLLLNSLKELDTDTAEVSAILARMNFDEHFKRIHTHYQQMKAKSYSNSNYIAATSAAKTLLIECVKAKAAFFQNDAAIDTKILTFKNTCNNAIETAKPVLEKHREWDKVFAASLLSIVTLPASSFLYAAGFFSIKTKSNQLLDSLHKDIDKPILQGGKLLTERNPVNTLNLG